MIVIGADTHKRSHTLVAVEVDALRFAAGLDEQRVWAIEDCRQEPQSARQAVRVAAVEAIVGESAACRPM